MQDVTVEGNGSTFMYHGKMTTFAAIESKNVVFQNFKVNFSVPTVIDITVEEKTENSATVFIPECYEYEINGKSITWLGETSPYTSERYWSGKNGMNYAQAINLNTGITQRLSLPLFSGVKDIEDLGNNRVKFNYTAQAPASVQTGICYQIRNTVRDHAGTFFWNSEDVTAKNLDIQYIHGFGMVGQTSTNITLDTINFAAPEESGRTTAGYADFIQMSGCKGLVKVVNSSFSNPHDDPINIHGTFLQVSERISDRQFKVQYKHNETAGFPNFFVGDEVEFMTKGNMIPVENSVAKVAAVEGPTSEDLTSIIITLDKDMPAEIGQNTHVVENITYTPSVEIKNNVFKETPTRGILVTTRKKVVIENNLFDGMNMSGIYISNDAQGWYESGPVKDVLIQNNTFTRCASPVIYIEPTNPTVSTEQTVHKNIKIMNNRFNIKDSQVLNAKSVDGLTFSNNIVNRYLPEIELSLNSGKNTLDIGEAAKIDTIATGKKLNSNLFSFNGCKNVLLENNQYDGGLRVNAAINNMKASDVTLGAEEKVVVQGAANDTDLVGKIYYTSSNEAVAKVSPKGRIESISAGKTNISAYTVTNGRKFTSIPTEITVSGTTTENKYPADISISMTGSDVITAIEDTRSFTAQITPATGGAIQTVSWSVKDPITIYI